MRVRAVAVGLGGAALAALIALPALTTSGERESSACPQPRVPAPPLEPFTTGEGEIRPEESSLVIPFGGGRNRAKRETPLDVVGVSRPAIHTVVRGDIRREDGLKVIPKGKNQVSVFVREDAPAQYTLVVCIDPRNPINVDPGLYQGNILILASGVRPANLPILVTLREDTLWVPILVALFGVVGGLVIKTLRDLLKGPGISRHSLRAYLSSGQFLVQAVTGLGVAGVVVWQVYLESPTFGGGVGDYGALLGGAFGGVVSGSILGDIGVAGISRTRGPADNETTAA